MKNRFNSLYRPRGLSSRRSGLSSRRGGFTLVEILVAVAIMSLLLSIIFVPLRLGFETYHIGKVNSDLQQEAHLAIQQIANDLRKSQFVFPNSRIPGVTDASNSSSDCSVAPYNPGTNGNDWQFRPYVISDSNTAVGQGSPIAPDETMAYGVCNANSVKGWNNPARIDMLQMRRRNNGTTANTSVGQDFIVSYYFRRLDITNNKPYDPIDNPIVLFRAQIPYRNKVGEAPSNSFTVPNNTPGEPNLNAEVDWTKYPDNIGTCNPTAEPSQTNRSFAWITHNYYGEANLEPLTRVDAIAKDASGNVVTGAQPVPGAHTIVTPSDMGLFVPRANTLGAEAFVPELSFTEEAIGGGRINRVTINMTLAKYDSAGATAVNGQGKSLKMRVSQTIDLPNAGCSN